MAISLEELKRQREQIQQHLNWLDAKIAALEPREAKSEVDTPPVPLEVATLHVETPTSTEPAIAPDSESNTQNEIKRAQIGCLVLFTLATLLFLFLLFGLPYLL